MELRAIWRQLHGYEEMSATNGLCKTARKNIYMCVCVCVIYAPNIEFVIAILVREREQGGSVNGVGRNIGKTTGKQKAQGIAELELATLWS